MATPRFSTAYDVLVVEDGIDFSKDPGYTKQEFKDECDINVLMSKYLKFGVPPAESAIPGQFGDFTSVPDLMEARLIVNQAEADFAALPSRVRDRFGNDPIALMKFVSDVNNRDEAIALGLVNAPPVPASVPVIPAAPAAPPQAAPSPGNIATPK